KTRVSIVRWNLKEVGGKLLSRGTRTISGIIGTDKSAIQDEVQYYPNSIVLMWRLNERKEITLTPGGLTRVPDKRDGISHRNKRVSDGGLNCKKSADAVVVPLGTKG